MISQNHIAGSPDQLRIAMRTKRILVFLDAVRQIARVYVMESGFASDLGGAQKSLGGRIIRFGHFIILMERGHMPGNIV